MMHMKLTKAFLSLLIAGSTILSARAQNAREVNVSIDNENKTAFVGDYNVSADVLNLTWAEHMKKAGMPSPGKTKGYTLYKGVILPEISTNRMDIYSRVDGKKASSTLTILVATGYNNFVSSANDGQVSGNVTALLNKLWSEAAAKQAQLALLAEITAQQKQVSTSEKDARKRTKDVAKLQSQRDKLEKKIAEANKQAANSAQAADAAKMKLSELNSRLVN